MHVVKVVGGQATPVLHRFGGAAGVVDVLAPDRMVDAEGLGVLEQELKNPIAQRNTLRARRTGNHDVEGQALGMPFHRVLPVAADGLDLGERRRNRAVGQDGVALQPVLRGFAGGQFRQVVHRS